MHWEWTSGAPGIDYWQQQADYKINIVLNDENKDRIKTLKANMKRLKLSAEVLNKDLQALEQNSG